MYRLFCSQIFKLSNPARGRSGSEGKGRGLQRNPCLWGLPGDRLTGSAAPRAPPGVPPAVALGGELWASAGLLASPPVEIVPPPQATCCRLLWELQHQPVYIPQRWLSHVSQAPPPTQLSSLFSETKQSQACQGRRGLQEASGVAGRGEL